ncbi:hypothetical protein [Luteibacter yeojuensis]|nr:hypothetical protein [Luteibacter yeojuensis]
MYPAHGTRTWHVSVDGMDGESYPDGLLAMESAVNRARMLEEQGFDVTVRQEGADGSWQVIRE